MDGTDDRTHLAYELSLTNISTANLMLERVRVLDPSRGGRVVDVLAWPTASGPDRRTWGRRIRYG